MAYDIPFNRRLGSDAILRAGLNAPGYRPQQTFYPPDYPVSRLLDSPVSGYGGGSPTQQASNVEPPPAYAPGGGEVANAFGYGGGSSTQQASNVEPPPAYSPGGGEVASPPLPPSRPTNLGQVLSRATVPVTSRAQAQQAPQPLTTNSLFGTVQLNPNQRNAPIYTALNVGSLFGGGGAPVAQPAVAPASQPSAPVGRTSLRAPSNEDWTFDANGSPIMAFPNTNLTPDQLSQAVSKPGWYRRLG
jgi:hypothetical protein